MALRGKSPESIEKRLKALFYGAAGTGKTTAAINFPRPYLIDTEKGAENDQYVEILSKNEGNIFQTNDFCEMLEEVKSLLSTKHPYKTLIIDPLTTIYNDLLEKAAIKVGSEYARHYGEANKHMKHLVTLLLRLDMNVIVTTHSKNKYGDNLKLLGTTYDCYNKLDYLFDLVFEVQKRGKDRVGIVKKTRIKSFEDGLQFPFSYEYICEKYGKNILEREAVSENLANNIQVEEIKRLIDLLKVPIEIWCKWLEKGNAETWDEMNTDHIQKCIDLLKLKFQNLTE